MDMFSYAIICLVLLLFIIMDITMLYIIIVNTRSTIKEIYYDIKRYIKGKKSKKIK